MKKRERLLLTLLSLLGFASACNISSCSDPDMYGVPRPQISYNISGKVVDKQGNPIPAIQVKDSRTNETATSGPDGTYTLASRLTTSTTIYLAFADIDGVANGEFSALNKQVTFTDSDFNHENQIMSRVGVDITLQPKE